MSACYHSHGSGYVSMSAYYCCHRVWMSTYTIAHMDMDMTPCPHIIAHMDMDMAPCPYFRIWLSLTWIMDMAQCLSYYHSHGYGYDSMSAYLSLVCMLLLTWIWIWLHVCILLLTCIWIWSPCLHIIAHIWI